MKRFNRLEKAISRQFSELKNESIELASCYVAENQKLPAKNVIADFSRLQNRWKNIKTPCDKVAFSFLKRLRLERKIIAAELRDINDSYKLYEILS